MDTLENMRLFAHAARTGNFSETARQLDLSPSSVSRQIGALEDALGVRLLHRTTRKVHLTEAGQLYYDRVGRILGDIEEAQSAVAELNAAPEGVLRVTVPVVFAQVQIGPLLPEFMRRYPRVKLEVFASDQVVDLVEEGFDLAIRLGALSDSSLVARRLRPMRRLVCGSPEYFARRGRPQVPAELADHDCLTFRFFSATSLWRPGAGTWSFADAEGKVSDVAVGGPLQSSNAGVLLQSAIGGAGLVLLPDWMLAPAIAAGELEQVLGDYRLSVGALASNIFAVFPSRRHLSPKVRVFVDFLSERLPGESVNRTS